MAPIEEARAISSLSGPLQDLLRQFLHRHRGQIWTAPDRAETVTLESVTDQYLFRHTWKVIAQNLDKTSFAVLRVLDSETAMIRRITLGQKDTGAIRYETERMQSEETEYRQMKEKIGNTLCSIAGIITLAIALTIAGPELVRIWTQKAPDAPPAAAKRLKKHAKPPAPAAGRMVFVGTTEQECAKKWGVIVGHDCLRLADDTFRTIALAQNRTSVTVIPGEGGTLTVSETYPDPFQMGMITRIITIDARGKLDGERHEFRRGKLLEPR